MASIENSPPPENVHQRVASLLLDANSAVEIKEKLEKLRQVQELIIHHDRDNNLLDNFLDEILGFQHDLLPDIRKFILGFTEIACKKDPEILTKVVANLGFLLSDDNVNVRKKVIVSMTSIFPLALKWVSKIRTVTNSIEQTWEYLVQLKNRVIPMLDDDNDGVRTYVIKFLEACILCQSCKPSHNYNITVTSSSNQNNGRDDHVTSKEEQVPISLDQIPRDHRLISYRKLEAEGKQFFQKILDMLSSQHVTSVNLMACMSVLTNVARQRPDFMERVILSFEALHVNLPPTLAKSQVSSVRKALKLHFLCLLKHPASISYQPQMTTLLTDLGATQIQVLKALPASSELRKRIRRIEEESFPGSSTPTSSIPIPGSSSASGDFPLADTEMVGGQPKKPRLLGPPTSSSTNQQTPTTSAPSGSAPSSQDDEPDLDEDDDAFDFGAPPGGSGGGIGALLANQSDEKRRQNAIDVTSQYLYKQLTPANVADLVVLSMIVLPDTMPAQFQSSFTPIAAAGKEAQIRHLARLMATQFTALGVGPGAELEKKAEKQRQEQVAAAQAEAQKKKLSEEKEKEKDKEKNKHIESVVGSTVAPLKMPDSATIPKKPLPGPPGVSLMPAGAQPGVKTSKRFHQFGLAHITKPMDSETIQRMTTQAFERILNAEKRVVNGGASVAHMKILVAMVSEFNNPKLNEMLEQYILSDQKSRSELAILWIHYEYGCYVNFIQTVTQNEDLAYEKYDRCLSSLLSNLLMRGEHKENLFHKMLLEAPLITPNSLDILKRACLDLINGTLALSTLREMILTRPKQRDEILLALIDFTCYEKPELRHQSLEIAKELYSTQCTKNSVHKYVVSFLHSLLESVPPNNLFGVNRGRLENPGKWEEDSIKACLYLYLYLLPVDYSLIHELAEVYVQTSNDTKRVILRLIESPIKVIGMQSPELLSLIENFPKGAETFVTKIVHLLTERSPPTLELVRRVRNLYHERVPDVRFLIPVLSGLNKREIIAALPKLIKLNVNVVKEVFNRLLHGKNLETGQQPLTPTELMVALIQSEFSSSEEAKPVMAAINILLTDKSIYTKEIMASVIQQLTEVNPLPTLLMRTIIQSVNTYPSLTGFVMNILHRLITKQIWKQPKSWEGFIKCCQKTRPQSFQVLMQLPTPALQSVFEICPDLKEAMRNHINNLSLHQAHHIPSNVLNAFNAGQSESSPAAQRQQQQPISEADAQQGQSGLAAASTADEPIGQKPRLASPPQAFSNVKSESRDESEEQNIVSVLQSSENESS